MYGRPPNTTNDALWARAARENPDPGCLVPAIAVGTTTSGSGWSAGDADGGASGEAEGAGRPIHSSSIHQRWLQHFLSSTRAEPPARRVCVALVDPCTVSGGGSGRRLVWSGAARPALAGERAFAARGSNPGPRWICELDSCLFLFYFSSHFIRAARLLCAGQQGWPGGCPFAFAAPGRGSVDDATTSKVASFRVAATRDKDGGWGFVVRAGSALCRPDHAGSARRSCPVSGLAPLRTGERERCRVGEPVALLYAHTHKLVSSHVFVHLVYSLRLPTASSSCHLVTTSFLLIPAHPSHTFTNTHALNRSSKPALRLATTQTQLTHRLLALASHLHLLVPTLRSSGIRSEEEELRGWLEELREVGVRRGGGGRMRGKLGELWALVGAWERRAEWG
ncbi:hypothetical protein B0H14DRAFT_3909292 [Mycena olivaceomarginata]|nr:hypothetical protein B0H14DRAFT_3909292 [Mycena olivaceomarginata]